MYEVICYATSPVGSIWRKQIFSSVEHFLNICVLSNGDGAQTINIDGIHTLVILSMATRKARATIPLRCNWLSTWPICSSAYPSATQTRTGMTPYGAELQMVAMPNDCMTTRVASVTRRQQE
ncbi:hypothetical protein F442_13322 [Phytophthora nicotianae P10297]|uniref:O-GlcNAc transferase C-terminal domain-containing protein n=1 Tax=Phytophthora nicotianae P10297 TaxID=1317064 RepID=W2YWP9_PHYNI|nr:hypothetical protein F442_13322 [Phytophthora nicotianae P10297]